MSYIQRSAEHLAEVLQGKNRDYTADMGEFYNFERAGKFAGTSPMRAILTQIGIKYTRIDALSNHAGNVVMNEPLKDSLLDLAGYALIAHAWLSREDEKDETREELLRVKYDSTWNPAG